MLISLHQSWEELCNFVACEKRCIPSLIGWHAEQEQFGEQMHVTIEVKLVACHLMKFYNSKRLWRERNLYQGGE